MATLDNLAELIMDEVSSYTDEVIKALEAKLDETADKYLNTLKAMHQEADKRMVLLMILLKQMLVVELIKRLLYMEKKKVCLSI